MAGIIYNAHLMFVVKQNLLSVCYNTTMLNEWMFVRQLHNAPSSLVVVVPVQLVWNISYLYYFWKSKQISIIAISSMVCQEGMLGPIKLVQLRNLYYQARKVNSHIFVSTILLYAKYVPCQTFPLELNLSLFLFCVWKMCNVSYFWIITQFHIEHCIVRLFNASFILI